jgi:hypothetical protein
MATPAWVQRPNLWAYASSQPTKPNIFSLSRGQSRPLAHGAVPEAEIGRAMQLAEINMDLPAAWRMPEQT